MFSFRSKIRITTDRLILRPPMHLDFKNWKQVRHLSRDFLTPWEPKWAEDHLTRKSFSNRRKSDPNRRKSDPNRRKYLRRFEPA